MNVRLVVLMGVGMHERTMPMLVRVMSSGRIEDAVRMFVGVCCGMRGRGFPARFCYPNRNRDCGEETKKNPGCRPESKRGGEKTCQRIGESPSGVAE